MAFSVSDYRDLVELLLAHPEWRAELRPLILGDEVLGMPAAQARMDERLDRLTNIVQLLAGGQAEIVVRMNRMDGRIGNIEGDLLEARYARHLRAWFGKWLSPVAIVTVEDLTSLTLALRNGAVTEAEADSLRDLDFILLGSDREAGGTETAVAVEISHTIHVEDVERAATRSDILRRSGYRSIPLVGGYRLGEGVQPLADRYGVRVDLRRLPAWHPAAAPTCAAPTKTRGRAVDIPLGVPFPSPAPRFRPPMRTVRSALRAGEPGCSSSQRTIRREKKHNRLSTPSTSGRS